MLPANASPAPFGAPERIINAVQRGIKGIIKHESSSNFAMDSDLAALGTLLLVVILYYAESRRGLELSHMNLTPEFH